MAKIIGIESMLANSLNKMDFPSITGKPAKGPIFPKPNTAEPSDITATVFHLFVYSYTSSLFSAIFLQGSATPGV